MASLNSDGHSTLMRLSGDYAAATVNEASKGR